MLISKLPKDIIRLLLFKYIYPSDLNNVLNAVHLGESTVFQEPNYTLKSLLARTFAHTFYMKLANRRLFQIARAKGKSMYNLKFSERLLWNSLAQCIQCGILVKKRNLKKHIKKKFHGYSTVCTVVEVNDKIIYCHNWEQWPHVVDCCLWKCFDPCGGFPRCKYKRPRRGIWPQNYP